ncbi:MAG TPA: TetR/AcrR family transcriptional regulator [Flexivirga sp.]|uniref:TetR/AcrR family transcriptional regulator n=1 Tax=Flexivirga sp. TaxID=1962927 RepID=UPI002C3BB170|nr:TetR/AcrR family transcriptional regulator [Flexivirga sp.]HWC24288.1 TetR/AcrR family transcriptional regulator [Flexivirga sp.]
MSGPREVLLAKAIGYFAEHGVRDTSLRTLAAAIGTSQRMLHYHFGSREDLLVAVIESVIEADAAMLTQLFANEPDPFEAGRENWRITAEHAQTFGALYFELSSHAMYGKPYARDLGHAFVTRTQEAFEAAYASLTDPATARRLARLTLAVGQGLMFDMLVDGDRAASDAAIEEFITLLRTRLGQTGETSAVAT